jgi:uncharacterized protein YigA (DUF484 family)
MNSNTELENDMQEIDDQNRMPEAVVDEEQVTINYLKTHPEFFTQHTDLLLELELQHKSGVAVSLIERQVNLLREQNKQQKVHLAELVEIARDNEQANQKIHKLILSLLSCKEMDACEVVMDEVLQNEFAVDAVALKLFIEPVSDQPEHLFVQKDTPLGKELEKLLNTRKPMCGFFKKLPMQELFDDKAQSVASLAVLPLYVEKNNCFGALVLGSNNMQRFSPDMGTLFLERLSETLSYILNSFISK